MLCLKINRTSETFYYNFAKIALISIEIGSHYTVHAYDLIKLQYCKTVVRLPSSSQVN